MTRRPASLPSKLNNRIAHLEDILRQIERWDMPYSHYGYYWGVRGEREYVTSLVKHALYGTPVDMLPKPEEIYVR